jgi:hypothetical protein
MKRFLTLLTVLLIVSTPFLVRAEIIVDTGDAAYWGGAETMSWGKDVIGDKFAVDTMDVTHVGDLWSVKLTGIYFANYLNNDSEVKDYGPGNLYISSRGWKTSTTDAYFRTDTFNETEGWDYVVSPTGIYALNNWDGIQKTNGPSGWYWRDGQAWMGGYTGDPIHGATIMMDTAGGSMTFNFSMAGIDLGDNVGFHWAMRCGNDVVEGGVSVPEPSSALLLLFGAAALLITAGIHGRFAFLKERIR